MNAQLQPVVGAMVVLVPEEKLRGRPDRYRRVPTDTEGKFKVSSMPPGRYAAYAFDEVSFDAVYNPEFLARSSWYPRRSTPRLDAVSVRQDLLAPTIAESIGFTG
jgi:hypothetical protein